MTAGQRRADPVSRCRNAGRSGQGWRRAQSRTARRRLRRQSETELRRCIPEHLETWPARVLDGNDDDGPAPTHRRAAR